jgi:hypothetical protein
VDAGSGGPKVSLWRAAEILDWKAERAGRCVNLVKLAPREVDRLPLAEIIAANLEHYRLDADYKQGPHFAALPAAWVSGFDKAARHAGLPGCPESVTVDRNADEHSEQTP